MRSSLDREDAVSRQMMPSRPLSGSFGEARRRPVAVGGRRERRFKADGAGEERETFREVHEPGESGNDVLVSFVGAHANGRFFSDSERDGRGEVREAARYRGHEDVRSEVGESPTVVDVLPQDVRRPIGSVMAE
jgi:hypothetical protein